MNSWLTRNELEELARNPATYFATVPERNNVILIIEMTLHCSYCGSMGSISGVRVDLPNGWVRNMILRYDMGDIHHSFIADYIITERIYYQWNNGHMSDAAVSGHVGIGYDTYTETWEDKKRPETKSLMEMLALLGPVR